MSTASINMYPAEGDACVLAKPRDETPKRARPGELLQIRGLPFCSPVASRYFSIRN